MNRLVIIKFTLGGVLLTGLALAGGYGYQLGRWSTINAATADDLAWDIIDTVLSVDALGRGDPVDAYQRIIDGVVRDLTIILRDRRESLGNDSLAALPKLKVALESVVSSQAYADSASLRDSVDTALLLVSDAS